MAAALAKVKPIKDALFECTMVYYENYHSPVKITVNQGGTQSGKTYAIMQVLYQIACNYTKTEDMPKCIITVTSEDVPALKRGAYRDAETIYENSPYLKRHVKQWHKGDRTITFHSGAKMEFVTSDSLLDAQQGKREYLFVNEANTIDYTIYWQLAIRTKYKIFLDYNPSAPFWVHEKLIGEHNVKLLISWHVHNTFLTQEQHDLIENEKDPNLWRVYARGLTGNLEGIIYTNWQIIEDDLFHEVVEREDNFFGGLDFGFTNDPTTGAKMVRTAAGLYVHEMFYKTDMGMPQVSQALYVNGWQRNRTRIWCDHVPDNISELRRLGILAANANKGQGSILAGITHLKKTKVFVTKSSTHYIDERKKYMWAKDKKTGDPINEPQGGYDHGMDAIRMGHYTQYFRAA